MSETKRKALGDPISDPKKAVVAYARGWQDGASGGARQATGRILLTEPYRRGFFDGVDDFAAAVVRKRLELGLPEFEELEVEG